MHGQATRIKKSIKLEMVIIVNQDKRTIRVNSRVHAHTKTLDTCTAIESGIFHRTASSRMDKENKYRKGEREVKGASETAEQKEQRLGKIRVCDRKGEREAQEKNIYIEVAHCHKSAQAVQFPIRNWKD